MKHKISKAGLSTIPEPTAAILESISDGVFTVDQDWRITSFNRAAEAITGVMRKEAIGKPCSEVFRASVCEGYCALRRTIETGKPVINPYGTKTHPRLNRCFGRGWHWGFHPEFGV
jgi:PAS domain-containing protein